MLNILNFSTTRVGGIRFIRLGRLTLSVCVSRLGAHKPLKGSTAHKRQYAATLAAVARDRAYNDGLAIAATRGDWQAVMASNSGPDLMPAEPVTDVNADVVARELDATRRAFARRDRDSFADECAAIIADIDRTLADMPQAGAK